MAKRKQSGEFMLGGREEDEKYFIHNKKRFESVMVEIEECYKKNKKMSVLDIGTSPLTFLIKQKYPKLKLATLDYSNNFKNGCRREGIIFIQQDLNKKGNKLKANSYDMILFLEVMEHLRGDNNAVLNNLLKSLKKGGRLLIQTPNKNSLKTLVVNILSDKLWDKMSTAPAVTEEFNHFKEYGFEELKKILQKRKDTKLIYSELPLYFDEPESTMVYRKNKIVFYPVMYMYFIFVTMFPNFRRGMYFKLVRT